MRWIPACPSADYLIKICKIHEIYQQDSPITWPKWYGSLDWITEVYTGLYRNNFGLLRISIYTYCIMKQNCQLCALRMEFTKMFTLTTDEILQCKGCTIVHYKLINVYLFYNNLPVTPKRG